MEAIILQAKIEARKALKDWSVKDSEKDEKVGMEKFKAYLQSELNQARKYGNDDPEFLIDQIAMIEACQLVIDGEIVNIPFTLKDRVQGHDVDTKCVLSLFELGASISFNGHSTYTSVTGIGEPLLLSKSYGDINISVWGDINSVDETDIISLKNARNENRDPTIELSADNSPISKLH